jgi:hypothetical protein
MDRDLKRRPGRRRNPRSATAIEIRDETGDHNDLNPAELTSLRECFEILDGWDGNARRDSAETVRRE